MEDNEVTCLLHGQTDIRRARAVGGHYCSEGGREVSELGQSAGRIRGLTYINDISKLFGITPFLFVLIWE